jgi:hypothetical protein
MTKPFHPDELDRVAARGGATATAGQASADEVAAVLDRALTTGRLARIPRNPRHRDIVLAILCLDLRRRHAYTEPEINAYLASALRAFEAGVDHVTCRRHLVDLAFLKRDRAGTRYLLNFPKLEATLSTNAARLARERVAARGSATVEDADREGVRVACVDRV